MSLPGAMSGGAETSPDSPLRWRQGSLSEDTDSYAEASSPHIHTHRNRKCKCTRRRISLTHAPQHNIMPFRATRGGTMPTLVKGFRSMWADKKVRACCDGAEEQTKCHTHSLPPSSLPCRRGLRADLLHLMVRH